METIRAFMLFIISCEDEFWYYWDLEVVIFRADSFYSDIVVVVAYVAVVAVVVS
jgi:hypothetical protein